MRAAGIALVKLLQRRLRGFRELAAIRESRALIDERGELAVLEIERSELAHLIPQQIEAGLAIRRARLELEHPVQQLQPDAVGDRDLLGERLGAGVRVEQLTLRGRPHQRLEFVLTVDVDQRLPRISQQLHSHGLPVEIRARAPVATDHAAHGELAVGLDRLFLEPAAQLARRLREIEGRGDLRAFGLVTNDLGARPTACEQLQRVDDDRLAGAGLTR
jgi:hypothetical protein